MSGESILYKSPYDDKEYDTFLIRLRDDFGLDLTGYKQHRVRRRIDMIMRKHKFQSYMKLLENMKKDAKLKDEFMDRLTINVTEFFRNPEKWEFLKKTVLPRLLRESSTKFRAWSAGCSTGEEPYTLSIILEEINAPKSAKILATDLDKFAISKAKMGIYEERSLVNIPQDKRLKYFIKMPDGRYKIKDQYKMRVNFRIHNLLMDPFEKNFDLIICRNVVIYFDMEAKNKLYKRFVEALRVGGVLFVGSTERIFNYRQLGLRTIEPFFYIKER